MPINWGRPWGWHTGIGTGASCDAPTARLNWWSHAPRNTGYKKEKPLTCYGAAVAPIFRDANPRRDCSGFTSSCMEMLLKALALPKLPPTCSIFPGCYDSISSQQPQVALLLFLLERISSTLLQHRVRQQQNQTT